MLQRCTASRVHGAHRDSFPLWACPARHSISRPTRGLHHQRTLRAMPIGAARADGRIGVLFVCLGNICRSPSAEAVFKAVVERQGLQDAFFIDSCGTGGGSADWYQDGGFSYHEGDPSDERMTAAAIKRGVRLTSRSRPLQPVDLSEFQYVIGMEAKNVRAIQTAADYWAGRPSGRGVVPAEYRSKLSLMTDYLPPSSKFAGAKLVPDPYYSGQSAFDHVLDLLEDCCEGLLQHIAKERQLAARSAA